MIYSPDRTVARAGLAFLQAIAEAQELREQGAESSVLADLLQHARELLEIIRDEILIANGAMPNTAQDALNELQHRVATLETLLVPHHYSVARGERAEFDLSIVAPAGRVTPS